MSRTFRAAGSRLQPVNHVGDLPERKLAVAGSSSGSDADPAAQKYETQSLQMP